MRFDYYKTVEFKTVVENVPGALHKVASAIAEKGVNIDSISAFALNRNEAVFRLITNDIETSRKALSQAPHVKRVEEGEIVVVRLDNKPGELAKLTDRLTRRGVDLESVYIVRANEKTEVALKAVDDKLLEEALRE